MDANSLGILAISVDWEFIKEVTELTLSFITTSAVVVAAWIGSKGIDSWRKESVGKRKIELAEDTLALFYEAEKAIIAIRSSLGYGGEGKTRTPQEGETPQLKAVRDRAFVVFERYKEREQVFNKLLSLRYRFMAQIGKTEAEPFEEIRAIINKIFQAARWLADLWTKDISQYTTEEQEKHFATEQKFRAIFWEGDDDDEIAKRLNKAVTDIEKSCKIIIMGK